MIQMVTTVNQKIFKFLTHFTDILQSFFSNFFLSIILSILGIWDIKKESEMRVSIAQVKCRKKTVEIKCTYCFIILKNYL